MKEIEYSRLGSLKEVGALWISVKHEGMSNVRGERNYP